MFGVSSAPRWPANPSWPSPNALRKDCADDALRRECLLTGDVRLAAAFDGGEEIDQYGAMCFVRKIHRIGSPTGSLLRSDPFFCSVEKADSQCAADELRGAKRADDVDAFRPTGIGRRR